MAWEQFDNPLLDSRLALVAGYLATRVTDRVIFDLNCGKAQLYDWLPLTFRHYYATDKNLQPLPTRRRERFSFFQLDDNDVAADRPSSYCDVLLVMGYAAHLNELESQTLDGSVLRIIGGHKPVIVVLDAWAYLPEKCKLSELVDTIRQRGYHVAGSWRTTPFYLYDIPVQPTTYADRRIHILERG